MDSVEVTSVCAATILFAGCTRTGNTPAPMTSGPMDAN